jgi:hypothetical protein
MHGLNSSRSQPAIACVTSDPTLVAYMRDAYCSATVVVELSPFGDFRSQYLTDKDLRIVENRGV